MRTPEDIEAARRYLRIHDKIGGYLPLLVMDPVGAAAWTRLWAAVRAIDSASEGSDVDDDLRWSLQESIRYSYPRLEQELRDLSQWFHVEDQLYGAGAVRGIDDYFRLMYYRAFCPVLICAVIGLPGERRSVLEAFAMYVAYGAQLMDDTLDIIDDFHSGKLYVTKEEFELLSLEPSSIADPTALHAVSRLRNKWALAYYLKAYRLTSLFAESNRNLARSWLGFGLRALLDGKITPLRSDILNDHRRYCHHFGLYLHLLDIPAPNEAWRYRLLRPLARQMVQRVSVVDFNRAEALFQENTAALPEHFMVQTVYGRAVSLPEPPEPVPDLRARVALAHYGLKGLLPTVVDLLRIALVVSVTRRTLPTRRIWQ